MSVVSSSSSSDSEWKYDSHKKPISAGGYVPPHLRVAAPKVVDMSSKDDFPSLGVKKATAPAWGKNANVNFAQKIKDLIAFEEQTEAEKEAAREAAAELEGYISLSLKFNKERFIEFNEKIMKYNSLEKICSDHATYYSQPTAITSYCETSGLYEINDDDQYSILSDDC
jgi:hypothetical protein